jgi:serine/threonine protein kinase
VVEAVYHELITIPPFLPDSKKKGKHRIGLVQSGRPFSSMTTLQQMLEIVFDILEGTLISIDPVLSAHMFAVLRYLRVERQVLHRDISKGNILYIEDETPPITPMLDAGSVPMPDARSVPIPDAGSVPIPDAGSVPMPDAGSVPMLDAGPGGADEAKEVSLCFIKYLLGKRYVRNMV